MQFLYICSIYVATTHLADAYSKTDINMEHILPLSWETNAEERKGQVWNELNFILQ